MPKLLMTDRAIAGLKPSGRATYFDEHTTGLALRVGARTRTWFYTYRNGGASEWFKLGSYPATSLADARQRARDARGQLDNGIDPAVERRTPPPAPEPETPPAPVFTFADFVPTFVKFQNHRGVREWANDEAKIKRHILPTWGPLPLNAIDRTHIHELLDTVAGKGLTVGVNRIQAVISRMFTVALDRGLIQAHPAARLIKRFEEPPRERVLTDDELRALWAGLDQCPGAAADCVRLRLLLGQRGGETAGLRWDELDLPAGSWTLPRSRTKTRQRQHVVALSPTALDILKTRRAIVANDEPRVFPGLTLQGDEHKALAAIHGGAYEWKDTRRTISTRLADLGFSETVIGRVLNHARHTVTAKHYNQHAYLDEIREALTAWDVELHRILANEPKKQTRVIRMRRR